MWSPPVRKSEPTSHSVWKRQEPAAEGVPSPPARPVADRRSRRGAAIIEFALLAPVLFMLVLGMIEFGRVLMVAQLLTDAAREGGRLAVVAGSNTDKVTSTVDSFLTNAGVNGAHTSVSPDPSAANQGDSITVTVTVPASVVSWLPTPIFTAGQTLSGSVIMRKESNSL